MHVSLPGTTHGVRRTDDAITRYVETVVVSRDPVYPAAFEMAVKMVAGLVRIKWELSEHGAEQAVRPIMRRLMPPTLVRIEGTRRAQ